MEKLEEAMLRLERAVAHLEAAGSGRTDTPSPGDGSEMLQLREIAQRIAVRVDGALAKIGRILGQEA